MTNELDRNTLSKEQLELETQGYVFSLDEDGKMVCCETAESIKYKMQLKYQRVVKINADLEMLGAEVDNLPNTQESIDLQIADLQAEKQTIAVEVEDYLTELKAIDYTAFKTVTKTIFGNLTY